MENPVSASLQTEALNQPSAANPSRTQEPLMYKNRLQQYAQRSSMQLPAYQTVNVESSHPPKFRSTVFVDGTSYTSVNTFSNRKAAEQDVAKLALESIAKKIKDEGRTLICEDMIFCKSILNEFAVKMNLEMPTYNTIQSEGVIPLFLSSLTFNGVTYNGKTARTKKDAEQLAACAALLSILDNSRYGIFLLEILKSKVRLYNTALGKVKDSNIFCLATTPTGANTSIHGNKEVETGAFTDSLPTSAVLQPSSEAKPPHNELVHKTEDVETATVPANVPTGAILSSGSKPHHEFIETAAVADSVPTTAILQPSAGPKSSDHEFKIPKSEPHSECMNLPITFVPSTLERSSAVGEISSSSSRKRRRKKKRARLHTGTQLAVAAVPLDQAKPCSTAL